MNGKFNKVLCVLFALIVCSSFVVTAFAAESVSVGIEASVKLSGTLPATSESFVIVMKSVDTGNESICTINGEGTGAFDKLTFSKPGKYKFTVKQKAGSNPDCTYDNAVYNVTITVFNSDNSYDFKVAATVYKDGVSEKQDSIVFANVYKTVTTKEHVTGEVVTEVPKTTEPASESGSTKTEESVSNTEPQSTQASQSTEEATTAKADESNDSRPNTGDNSRMPLWVVMFVIGLVLISGSLVVLMPKKRDL